MGSLARALALGWLAGMACVSAAEAQITVDGTLRPARELVGPDYAIGSDLGRLRGPNLFHSFGRFDLAAGERATFTGPASVQNILGRVTGGHASSIDGTVRSTIPDANLFLINSAGLVFGPNAVLQIGGSFHASTADSVRLGARAEFRASAAAPGTLAMAPPTAFGFLGAPPAGIRVVGSALQVPAARSLSLSAGEIQVTGAARLRAPGGRIDLLGVASPGRVAFDAAAQRPVLAADDFAQLGRVRLSQGSTVDARGDPGGGVAIRGERLRVDGGAVIVAGTGALAGASPAIDLHLRDAVVVDGGVVLSLGLGAGRAGDVRIEAGAVRMQNDAFVASSPVAGGAGGDLLVAARRVDLDRVTLTSGTTGLGGVGRSGDIAIEGARVRVTGGTAIDSSSEGAGQGGTVRIAATGSLLIAGRDPGTGLESTIAARTSGTGDAGRVEVTTPVLILDGGRIAAQTFAGGRAGDIALDVGQLTLMGGASIGNATLGTGRGGTIRIDAWQGVAILDAASDISSFAGAAGARAGHVAIAAPVVIVAGGQITTATIGAGPGGRVDLQVGALEVTEGGLVDSSTFGAGRGGPVRITAAERVSVAGRDAVGAPSRITSATQGGDAGRVVVAAPTLVLDDGGTIGVFTIGGAGVTGRAGTVALTVDRLLVTRGGLVDASTDSAGAGGAIVIAARERVSIAGRDASGASAIRSLATDAGDGGRIAIGTPELVADGAGLVTRTQGAGRAGSVALDVGRLVLTGGAFVDSTSLAAGRGGDVAVAAAERVTLDGGSVVASGTIGLGRAGDIAISAPRLDLRGGSALSALTLGDAPGGDIALEVGRLSITGDAFIDSTSRLGAGAGGSVTVRAREAIDVASGRISTSAGGSGPGGTVALRAPRVTLSAGSRIEATSSAAGDAGGLLVRAGEVFTSRGSQVTTSAASADGGNIAIRAGRLVHLVDSQVTAAVQGGAGGGGNIDIGFRSVVLDGAQVRADAFGGPGGNVFIAGDVFLASADSVVSASSALGLPGVVDVRAEVREVSGRLARLPESELQAAELLRQACAARHRARRASTLLAAGHARPPEPGGPMLSPFADADEGVGFDRGAGVAARGPWPAPPGPAATCSR